MVYIFMFFFLLKTIQHNDGLIQDCSNSSVLAMELQH